MTKHAEVLGEGMLQKTWPSNSNIWRRLPQVSISTLPETNIAPENRPPQ